ncbi:hypothetical protein KPL78_08430 [Roseomonas sp. HJA6]|uniref:Lipoprotein n=2 Tax=Roseomonas alba TaxID=2846776 RepID=A0ABS7A6C9_9PROT|nr:hypothetical protein [Neoroseomonas alba]
MLLIVAALGSGCIGAGAAAPAMANVSDADHVLASAEAGRGPDAAPRGHGVGAPAGERRASAGQAVSQNFVNQGPHSFGDPMASGRNAAGSMASPNFANQGPHGFGDPMASGRTATGSMASPNFANQGPHAFGGPVGGGAAVAVPAGR